MNLGLAITASQISLGFCKLGVLARFDDGMELQNLIL